MKKLLTLFLLTAFISAYSQKDKTITYVFNKTSNAIEKVYTDGTKVVEKAVTVADKLAPKIETALSSLGDKLKVGADKVWDILVKQQVVWSVAILIGLILTILSWIHFFYRIKEGRLNNWQTSKNNESDPSSYHVVAVVSLFFAITGSIITATNFLDMLTGFINPEFGAMKAIAEIASQIK